ncbi:uncharacterized protein DS421_19g670160 [Arachis hypogaea]|uniref:Ubiquitin-like protease family profile domain-containing protein n=1 Tax=Arachis hypogaea TaxID=3818 RepID=A0A6B9VDG7_ARAHY|nr:uncharacterized protein DS421_19g670160 [Arachis hypogaea]
MATESYRMEFKRYFLLVWFDKAVEKYKLKGNKTCEGCMFVMLGHLLTRQGEGEDIKGRSPQAASRKPGKKAPQKRGRKDSVPPRGSSVSGKSKQVASERRPSGRTTAPHPIRRSSQCAEGAKTSPRPTEQEDFTGHDSDGIEVYPMYSYKGRSWHPMKEGNIYHWSERTSAHCYPSAGSTATSFSGCVQPLMTHNHCDLGMTFTVFLQEETVLQKRNLDSFREVPTVSYVGLGPHFSDDSRFFDKIAASMQKWWFAPVCIDRHWWLYTFEIAQKRLWVLDSMYSGEHNNERLKIHAYAGRIIEDMAKVSMPAYEPMEKAYLVSIPASQNNITGRCDCGVFVIKFMQFWSLEKPLQLWDKDVVQEFWKEIILDIVMSPHNSQIGKALQALDSDPVRRNQPRKKTKAVRSPFTAPSTKSMLQRAGLPTRKPNKGEDNGRRHMPRFISCEPDKSCFTAGL